MQNSQKLSQIYGNFAKKSEFVSNMLIFNQHPLLSYIVQKILRNDSNLYLPWIFTLMQAIFHDDSLENIAMHDLYSQIKEFLDKGRVTDFLKLVNTLPPSLSNSLEIQCIRDQVFCHLITATRDVQYINEIKSPWTLFELGLNHYVKWPAELTRNVFSCLKNFQVEKKLPIHYRMKIDEISYRIELYFKILPYLKKNVFYLEGITWLDIAYCSEKTDPASIIQILIRSNESKLCLEWLMKQNLVLENLSPVLQNLLIALLRNDENDFELAKKVSYMLTKLQITKRLQVLTWKY